MSAKVLAATVQIVVAQPRVNGRRRKIDTHPGKQSTMRFPVRWGR
jgi:hypothetical protein